jgi:hypothetical protein
MAHLADKTHYADKTDVDRHPLARVNSAILIVLIGGSLLLCVFGAVVYDLGRLFSTW